MPSNTSPMRFTDAVKDFQTGALTPRAFLESLIESSGLPEDPLNIFASLDLESARRQADAATERYARGTPLSPIDGLPMGIKDIIHTAALPTCMGSALYDGWRPRANATAVDALLESGAVLLGKTHTTEFAIGRATVTRNPHDTGRTPGGSSSGTAAGVAARMFCAGLGTQTQGSIVRPASYCGVVGYKPTWGILPLEGVHPVSGSHDHLGVIAESVDTAWSVAHSVLKWLPGGAQSRLADACPVLTRHPCRRLGLLLTGGYDELNPKEQSVFEAGLSLLARAGIRIVHPREDPDLSAFCRALDVVPEASVDMVARDMIWPYAEYCRRDSAGHLSDKIRNLVERGRSVTPERYEALRRLRSELRWELKTLALGYDAFILPAASGVAPAGLENTGSRTLGVYASFLGAPAVSLPGLSVGGLPLGVQLIGAPLDDYSLLCRARHVHGIMLG